MIAEYTVKRNGRWYKAGALLIYRHLPLNMELKVQKKSAERN